MASIPLPQISFVKRKQRSQMCRLYTDDGRVVDVELDVSKSCIIDSDFGKGYLISAVNQFYRNSVGWQILYEKSSLPIALREDLNTPNLKKLITQIAMSCLEEAQRKQYKEALKNKLMDKILWVVAMPCTVFLIWGVMAFMKR